MSDGQNVLTIFETKRSIDVKGVKVLSGSS